MITPSNQWLRFKDNEERLQYFKQWGLIPKTAKTIRAIAYCGRFSDKPVACEVLGYDPSFPESPWAVIEVRGELHSINGELLAEQQPSISSKLLSGILCMELWQDYVVVDIETTGFSRETDKIIEIAAIRYSCGEKAGTYHTMINPGCPIPKEITELTGITQADVANAPGIEAIADAFIDFLGESPIVGHNALSFDVPFLSYHLRYDLPNKVIDTVTLSRKLLPGLSCYKLQYLNRVLSLGANTAHRAMADVETTNALLLACMVPEKYSSKIIAAAADAKAAKPKDKEDPQKKDEPKKKAKAIPKFAKYGADYRAIQPTVCVGEDCPLFGKNMVFTGELSIPREEAMQMAVNAGAVLKNNISGKTDYLVVGKQDITIVGMDSMSKKEEKAHAFNAAGGHIKIIYEDEFMRLLEGEREDLDDYINGEEGEEATEEMAAFQTILPELVDILSEQNLSADSIKFRSLVDKSSVYFINTASLVCGIRIRKETWYVVLPERYEKLLPAMASVTRIKSDSGVIRVSLSKPQDILLYKEAIRASLRDVISKFHTFDCCGRYEQCSDEKRCVHPDPTVSVGCWYKKNLLAGRIFYGKNKNIP